MQDGQQDDYEWSTKDKMAKVGHQGDDCSEKDASWDTYMQVNGGDGFKWSTKKTTSKIVNQGNDSSGKDVALNTYILAKQENDLEWWGKETTSCIWSIGESLFEEDASHESPSNIDEGVALEKW